MYLWYSEIAYLCKIVTLHIHIYESSSRPLLSRSHDSAQKLMRVSVNGRCQFLIALFSAVCFLVQIKTEQAARRSPLTDEMLASTA
jgi:hypothetical protein